MDDALQHGRPAGAQGNDVEKQCYGQQRLILGVKPELQALTHRDGNYGNRRDRQANGRQCGSQCQVQTGLQPIQLCCSQGRDRFRQTAKRWTFEQHYQQLMGLFARVAGRKQAA